MQVRFRILAVQLQTNPSSLTAIDKREAQVPKFSAGLLMYRMTHGVLEVLLVHPGGPFWSRKHEGAWFVPKGELNADEDPLAAARREFHEETGFEAAGPFIPLGEVRHNSGKRVVAWAVEGDWDTALLRSNSFSTEWPPRSGKVAEFPEVDRAEFMVLAEAQRRIHPAEWELVERLSAWLTDRDQS